MAGIAEMISGVLFPACAITEAARFGTHPAAWCRASLCTTFKLATAEADVGIDLP